MGYSDALAVAVSVGSTIYAIEKLYYYPRDERREERHTKAQEDLAVILTRLEKIISKDSHADL